MSIVHFKRAFTIGFVGVTILVCSAAYSGETEFKNLNADDLKQLIDSDHKVFLLNPLPRLMFRQANIPGSVNIRWNAIKDSRLLPDDKETTIVTYCMGTR